MSLCELFARWDCLATEVDLQTNAMHFFYSDREYIVVTRKPQITGKSKQIFVLSVNNVYR